MKKTYATLDDLMTEIYQAIGVELAPDYDVFAIANDIYTWEGDELVADLERDDFWLIVANHDLTEDWHASAELPEEADADVATIVNACTYAVRMTGSCTGADTITEWFQRVCMGIDGRTYTIRLLADDTTHLLARAKMMTSEWRNAASPLTAERDRIEAWDEACKLCEYKEADPTDSRNLCKALHIVESDPSWLFNLTLHLFQGNASYTDFFADYEI